MAISAFSDARAHGSAADNTMDMPAVLAAPSLEEKAVLLSGQRAWETSSVERQGVSPAVATDGACGVRLQYLATGSFTLPVIHTFGHCLSYADFGRSHGQTTVVGEAKPSW